MYVSLRGGRDGFGIADGIDLDYTCYMMGVDWVLGVLCMKITNALDHSGAHGDD